jgi:hypothetical protein
VTGAKEKFKGNLPFDGTRGMVTAGGVRGGRKFGTTTLIGAAATGTAAASAAKPAPKNRCFLLGGNDASSGWEVNAAGVCAMTCCSGISSRSSSRLFLRRLSSPTFLAALDPRYERSTGR